MELQAEAMQEAAKKFIEMAEMMERSEQDYNAALVERNSTLSPGTRLDQLKQFIKENPGLKRGAIVEGTGIPVGTVGVLLRPDNGFESRKARWYVKETGGEE